ncbi:MAG: site-specific DNA-methyltransferase [Desulfobacteria bacterium]
MVMSIEKMTLPKRLDEEKIEALKQLFPEIFADGTINLDALREEISDALEDVDVGEEHYGLNWPGKKYARKLAAMPSAGTLVPDPGEGVDEETTQNIFIEGDNLEVLKVLKGAYAGRVKMIYIDPPYNTGNDFIYKDDFKEPVETYLRRTGQEDEEGLLTSNPKASGRFHSNWLTFMYPRLKISRDLLKDDGVIFVSIDQHEVHNLRLMMNEIFGEENFIATVSVVNNLKGRSDETYIATAHDYIMLFQRGEFETYGIPLPEDYYDQYTERDEIGRPYRLQGLRKRGSGAKREDRPNMYYPFYVNTNNGSVSIVKTTDHNIKVFPKLQDGSDGRWRWGVDTAKSRIHELIARKVSGRDEHDIFEIDYAEEDGSLKTVKPKSVWLGTEFSSDAGTKFYKEFMKGIDYPNPKPPALIRYCLLQATKENDIILDFFAGSGTTAHAIFDLNHEVNENLKFILVQIPEPTGNKSYPTIAEIAKERIRRVSTKLKDEGVKGDLGFRVYKLSKSNVKRWQKYTGESINEVENLFMERENSLIDGWKVASVLTEIILREGFPLDSKIRVDISYKSNKVWQVSHETIEYRLFVCLDKIVGRQTSEVITGFGKDVFVCLDAALNDEEKLILSDAIKVKTL